MALENDFMPTTAGQPVEQAGQPASAASANRWSYHLGNDPFGGATGQWAKQYYDNPNIDPGAALQNEASAFRRQYGGAAPEDDRSIFDMIATGQTPQAPPVAYRPPTPPPVAPATPSILSPEISTGQFPVKQLPEQVATVQSSPRNTELYDLLLGRAKQSTAIDRNDPIIRAQSDAYRANETRASRDYIADMAEKQGPLGNIQGEARMAAERVGQRTGGFEAQLMGRELTARRDEISNAITQMGAMLSDEEKLALTRELGLLNAAIAQQGVDVSKGQLDLGWGQLGVNEKLGLGKLGIDQQGQDLAQALGLGRLGLDAEGQSSYWDWIRSGGQV